jgi:hypothetical protein
MKDFLVNWLTGGVLVMEDVTPHGATWREMRPAETGFKGLVNRFNMWRLKLVMR